MALSRRSYCLWVHCVTGTLCYLYGSNRILTPFTDDARQHPGRDVDLLDRHEFFGGMCQCNVAGSEADRWNPRFIERRRVSPRRQALDFNGYPFALERAAQSFHDRRVRRNIARKLCRIQCNPGCELRMRRPDTGECVPDLSQRLFCGLARKCASLDRKIAQFRISGHSDSPLNFRGMERAATEQLMARTRLARALELFELSEEEACVGDSVDSDVVAASVRCPSGHNDVHPDEATMGGADRQSSGLSDNCRFRADPVGQQCAHAEAFVLLVDDGGDENLPAGIRLRAFRCSSAHRGNAALHVSRAAAVDTIAADLGGESIVDHSLDADDIQVAIEHQGGRVTGSNASDDVWPARSTFHQLDRESPIVEHRREGTSAITLAR